MRDVSTYQVWRLICNFCGERTSPLAWDYQLPTHCLCGGALLHDTHNMPDDDVPVTMYDSPKRYITAKSVTNPDDILKEFN